MLPQKHFDKIEKEAMDMLKSSTVSSDLPALNEKTPTKAAAKKVIEINDNIIDTGKSTDKDFTTDDYYTDDYNYDDELSDEVGNVTIIVPKASTTVVVPTTKPKTTSTVAPSTTAASKVENSKWKLISDQDLDEDELDDDEDSDDDDMDDSVGFIMLKNK